jgi:hypothetical protein
MATEITYRGDERELEFQVVAEDGTTPVPWVNVTGLILVLFYDKNHILMRFSKNAMPGFTPITNVTNALLGIFEVFVPSEITAPTDPSRPLQWEAKVTVVNANSPDGFQDMITTGVVTEIDDAITRNMPTS